MKDLARINSWHQALITQQLCLSELSEIADRKDVMSQSVRVARPPLKGCRGITHDFVPSFTDGSIPLPLDTGCGRGEFGSGAPISCLSRLLLPCVHPNSVRCSSVRQSW